MNPPTTPPPPLVPRCRLWPIAVLVLAMLIALPSLRAELPAPDNILYGTLTLQGGVVTASSNLVSVEARRTPDGPAIATYRMGADPAAENFYVLRLPVEELPAGRAAEASGRGDTIYVLVRVADANGPVLQYTFRDPGSVVRMDFGVTAADSDSDGLPDAWEIAQFGNLSASGVTPGANGRTAAQSFIEGAAPAAPGSAFLLTVTLAGTSKTVSFQGRRAEGPGYAGYTRHYLLESCTNMNDGAWIPVRGFEDIVGNNQQVQFTTNSSLSTYFRGQVRLTQP